MRDFVGVYDGAFPVDYCQDAINYFERLSTAGYAASRQSADQVPKYEKEDLSVSPTSEKNIQLSGASSLNLGFLTNFWGNLYKSYESEYDILMKGGKPNIWSLKIQKTPIGGGYHNWHCENYDRNVCQRFLAFILYLNDVPVGGETEFLYYPLRVEPKAGRFLIFPGGFTHAHRGNPPISNEKYIITGWVEY